MRSFLQRHESETKGVLSRFDRIRFRGTIRWLGEFAQALWGSPKHFQ